MFLDLAHQIILIGQDFHRRGWALGTSGNYSAVLQREPLQLAITVSGADKGALTPEHILHIDGAEQVLAGAGRPSDETKLHLAILRQRDAGAILHTHSVWGTILSDLHGDQGGLSIEGYEMLKGLAGVHTHTHREWLPIIENAQEMNALGQIVERMLSDNPNAHGFLLRRHGLYTWGRNVAEARRHVETFEFLFEVLGQRHNSGSSNKL